MIADHNKNVLNQFEEYLIQIALSPLTIANYLADLRVFTRWAERDYSPEFSLISVTPDQIRSYRTYLLTNQKRAPSTVNRHLQALRKWCNYTAQTNLAPNNAAEEISLISSKKEIAPDTISEEDSIAFLEAANQSRSLSIAKRDLAILSLLLKAGLRVAEVADLQIDDVIFDFPGVHLHIRDSRAYGTRDIPLSAEVCKTLKDWLLIRPKTTAFSQVFLSQEGKAISVRTIQRIVNRCAKAIQLTGITAQLLRRTYAMNLLAQTHDLDLVQQRLGHQNQLTTLRYLKLKKITT